jgi:hypothetical protein
MGLLTPILRGPNATFLGNSDFIQKYPGHTQRVVKTLLLAAKTSPLIDPYVVARYGFQISEAKRLGLTRATFDFNEWAEARFLNAALQELGLQSFWAPRDESGKPRL